MQELTLIFPHQLFSAHPALQKNRPVILVEEWLFFRQYNFHKHKLILHRSSMKCYADKLIAMGFTVIYVDTTDPLSDIRELVSSLHDRQVATIHLAEVADNWLQKRLTNACKKYNISITVYTSPGFLNTMEGVAAYFDGRKRYFQTDFYIHQRKQRKILLDTAAGPMGGKWSFDADNRLRFPKKTSPPPVHMPHADKYIIEAKDYILMNFPGNTGSAEGPYLFVAGQEQADKWLNDFLFNRFEKFGMYEDAIVGSEHVLHHSVLTPMLNCGLLEPHAVTSNAIAYAEKKIIPLNSLEGFIRQVMGWREFIRIVYEREGSKQRITNYWKFTRKIPDTFRTGTTGIIPVDTIIKKVLKTGYCHHIERLMVLGNFMLLCEFDPDEVYRWFMEMFIDAYDWVMVPNVYGMSQFADGGLMTTKPYISGSNYLLKMGDFQKGEWQHVWDGLFWRFMMVHRDFFLQNPRLAMLVQTLDNMTPAKRNTHLDTAEKYLASLI